MEIQEDLYLRFSDGVEIKLPFGRNYRNTSVNDVVVVESEFTKKLLFCGGLMAYIISEKAISRSVVTSYPDGDFPPLEYRVDWSSFEVFCEGVFVVLLWDFGVVVFDNEFNPVINTKKYANDNFKSLSSESLVLINEDDGEVSEIRLAV